MSDVSESTTDAVSLSFSREEAEMLVEALKVKMNCRRFSFKEPDEDFHAQNGKLVELHQRLSQEVKVAFQDR